MNAERDRNEEDPAFDRAPFCDWRRECSNIRRHLARVRRHERRIHLPSAAALITIGPHRHTIGSRRDRRSRRRRFLAAARDRALGSFFETRIGSTIVSGPRTAAGAGSRARSRCAGGAGTSSRARRSACRRRRSRAGTPRRARGRAPRPVSTASVPSVIRRVGAAARARAPARRMRRGWPRSARSSASTSSAPLNMPRVDDADRDEDEVLEVAREQALDRQQRGGCRGRRRTPDQNDRGRRAAGRAAAGAGRFGVGAAGRSASRRAAASWRCDRAVVVPDPERRARSSRRSRAG